MPSIRLQKLIARYGYSSRRKAEQLIREGRVLVDGDVVHTLGIKVSEDSIVEIDGEVINRAVSPCYLMLNKPPGRLCSRYDSRKRPLIYDLLDKNYRERGLFSVGRLDFMSEGLLLLTNDGDFAHRVSHPSSGITKKYLVLTDMDIPYKVIDSWKNGIYINRKLYTITDFKRITPREALIVLREGKNREIRELFNNIDIKIIRLKRIAIGTLELGCLPPGKFRELSESEIAMLKNWKGSEHTR